MTTAFEVLIDGTPTDGANPLIDSLVFGGAWEDADGGTVTISYATPSGYDAWLGATAKAWTSSEKGSLNKAMKLWQNVADVKFVKEPFATSDTAFWKVATVDAQDFLGWSEVPGYSSGEPLYTYFDYQVFLWGGASHVPGAFGFGILVHELGHLLGLAHPHDGGDAPDSTVFPGIVAGTDESAAELGDDSLNQGINTTMTYNDGWPTEYPAHNNAYYGWQATPMALDIAAIQAIYGANTTFASGNNTYVIPNSNKLGTAWKCIWDTGGTDTLKFSGGQDCTIDLNDAPLVGPNAGGYVSWSSGIVGGWTIANGVVIERAIGGGGNDTINGNEFDNFLKGNGGNDDLSGQDGNDTLVGGGGNDTADGGVGDDLLKGNFGDDTLLGSDGFDTLLGGGGVDTIDGGADDDLIKGHAGDDILFGGDGNDTIMGNGGNDTIDGGAGDDVFILSGGSDAYIGGSGSDTVVFNGDKTVRIDLSDTSAQLTGLGSQTFTGVENLTGGKVRDFLTGDTADNILSGSGGSDFLYGGTGADTLVGGFGRDHMYGGIDTDVDVFVFASAGQAKNDNIFDFVSGTDLIDLAAIDANTKAAGDDQFVFNGTSSIANGVWYSDLGSDTMVQFDVTGDGRADGSFLIAGVSGVSEWDFLL